MPVTRMYFLLSLCTIGMVSSSPHIGALTVGLFVELLISIILAIFLLDRSTKILIVKDCATKVRRVVASNSCITDFGPDGWNTSSGLKLIPYKYAYYNHDTSVLTISIMFYIENEIENGNIRVFNSCVAPAKSSRLVVEVIAAKIYYNILEYIIRYQKYSYKRKQFNYILLK